MPTATKPQEAAPPVKTGVVGSYNYNAAAARGGATDTGSGGLQAKKTDNISTSPSKRGHEGAVRFGRRAGSSDGLPSNSNPVGAGINRDSSQTRNRSTGEGRPQTDPSVIASIADPLSTDESPARRDVHYKPYSVNDYRRMKEELAKKQSRGLGPSDTDEQRAAAARAQRQKEYGENIKRVNRLIMGAQPTHSPGEGESGDAGGVSPRPTRAPIVQPTPQEVIEKQQRRERANEYAKRVPKPKVRPSDAKPEVGHDGCPVNNAADELWGLDADVKKQEKERNIADLEARHAQDQQMVANMKKQLRI
jgi:hypothetical protein